MLCDLLLHVACARGVCNITSIRMRNLRSVSWTACVTILMLLRSMCVSTHNVHRNALCVATHTYARAHTHTCAHSSSSAVYLSDHVGWKRAVWLYIYIYIYIYFAIPIFIYIYIYIFKFIYIIYTYILYVTVYIVLLIFCICTASLLYCCSRPVRTPWSRSS